MCVHESICRKKGEANNVSFVMKYFVMKISKLKVTAVIFIIQLCVLFISICVSV